MRSRNGEDGLDKGNVINIGKIYGQQRPKYGQQRPKNIKKLLKKKFQNKPLRQSRQQPYVKHPST